MGTMRGPVGPEHPRAHSDEWVFRSDRRNARGRGPLSHTLPPNAVQGQPVAYQSPRKTGRTQPGPPPTQGARRRPPGPDAGRPELPRRSRTSAQPHTKRQSAKGI